jgi:pimeloyl-ACP methyl ester carboxylesterase
VAGGLPEDVTTGRARRVLYLHGIAGGPAPSPALDALAAGGIDVVAPALPGFDGAPGFEAPADHLGWLTRVSDVLDATGALPCPVIGASVGGMLAADLAALRPEAVERLALLGPLGLWDDAIGGEDLFALPAVARHSALFAGAVPAPFTDAFADRGADEQPVAQHLAWVAAAGLVWPLPDRGLAGRLHRVRCPRLVVWGALDRIAPVAYAPRWADDPVVVDGAGHLVEWDAPAEVAEALLGFLR